MKESMYRGKTVEELKKIGIREFALLLPSREKRSILRQSDKIEKFVSRCDKKIAMNKAIRTNLRALVIVPKMVGLTIEIHNGQEFMPIKITTEMLGHRLGEFAMTRKKVEHSAPGIGATRSSAFLSVK